MAFTYKPTQWNVSLNENKQAIMVPIRDTNDTTRHTYLTFTEIQRLSEDNQLSYYHRQTEQLNLDPLISQLHEDMVQEDRRVHELELEMDSEISEDD
jgi:hypothetical protein